MCGCPPCQATHQLLLGSWMMTCCFLKECFPLTQSPPVPAMDALCLLPRQSGSFKAQFWRLPPCKPSMKTWVGFQAGFGDPLPHPGDPCSLSVSCFLMPVSMPSTVYLH